MMSTAKTTKVTEPETGTKKFKKATARFARSELKKTAYSIGSAKVIALEIAFAVAVGLTVSYGYVTYAM